MVKVFNEDGEELEGVLLQEEAKELQEQIKTLEEQAEKVKEMENALKEKEEALSKLSGKDLNFQRLRHKTEQEVEDMKKKMTEKERLLLTEIMDLTKERDEEKTKRFEEVKNDVLNNLAGEDEELKKAISIAEKELIGDATTPKEIEERYRKAFMLAKGVSPTKNPIYSRYSSSYSEPDIKPKRFTDTEDGKEAIKTWFPDIADKIIK